MILVVLDASPLDAGDLHWAPLGSFGELRLHSNTEPQQVAERIAEADVVFTNKVPLRADALQAARHLRLVSVLATGYDVVDVAAAQQSGVTVCNVPSYSAAFTAQSTLALLLELTHHAGAHDAAIRDGQWQRAGTFSFWNYPLVDLSGKTLLVVGTGNIGSRVARLGTALEMRVQAAELPGRRSTGGEFPCIPLDDALPQADVVSLHCPLTPATRGLIGAERLARFRPGALLVNTARGLLVDEAAVAAALHAGHLGGYAADVLGQEPPPPDHPLLRAPRCLLTPHLSWASRECRQRLLDTTVENVRCFLSGRVQNQVKSTK